MAAVISTTWAEVGFSESKDFRPDDFRSSWNTTLTRKIILSKPDGLKPFTKF